MLVVLLNYEFLFRTCFIRILNNQMKCTFPYKLQLVLKYLSNNVLLKVTEIVYWEYKDVELLLVGSR